MPLLIVAAAVAVPAVAVVAVADVADVADVAVAAVLRKKDHPQDSHPGPMTTQFSFSPPHRMS